MTGTQVVDIFQEFQVTIPEGQRYWEDDSTGVIIKKGQLVTIGPRQFRSSELRFALLRNQVLIKSGQAQFAFRRKIVKVSPGEKKNIIEDVGDIVTPGIQNEKVNTINKEKVQETISKKEVKKINKKPDLDDIPDLEEE